MVEGYRRVEYRSTTLRVVPLPILRMGRKNRPQLPAQLPQSLCHLRPQVPKIPFYSAVTSNQYMVRAGPALVGEQFARQLTKTPSHPVADHSIADFFGDGDPQPFGRIIVAPVKHQQNKTGGGVSLPPVGGQKICPFPDDGITAHHAACLKSGRQFLAATRAATVQDIATSGG
jgi:hypothetical protein